LHDILFKGETIAAQFEEVNVLISRGLNAAPQRRVDLETARCAAGGRPSFGSQTSRSASIALETGNLIAFIFRRGSRGLR
jgi:hypothetical protein